MRIGIYVDKRAATLAGADAYGWQVVTVPAKDLTPEQRAVLSKMPEVPLYNWPRELEHPDYSLVFETGFRDDPATEPPVATAPTVDEVRRLLDAVPGVLAAREAAIASDVERAVCELLCRPAEDWTRTSTICGVEVHQGARVPYICEALAVKNAVLSDSRVISRCEEMARYWEPIAAADCERAEAARAERCRQDEAARAERCRQDEAAREEAAAWIAKHGSSRLRRMLDAGIECDATYRDERLAVDLPGWEWDRDEWRHYEPRNVPEWALDLLAVARSAEPGAELIYLTIPPVDEDHEDGEGCDLERTYAVRCEFLGRLAILRPHEEAAE